MNRADSRAPVCRFASRGIVVGMLFDLEDLVSGFEFHADLHIESLGLFGCFGVVGVFDVLALPGV